MIKEKLKKNRKRILALSLSVVVAAGSVDISQLLSMNAYAFSREYGICTDNHLYSEAGANCSADQYKEMTIDTQNMTHGSDEWKAAIEHNKQALLDYIGDGDPRTVMKTLWGAINVACTGNTEGLNDEAKAGAQYWYNELHTNVETSIQKTYWDAIPTTFTVSITEAELGIVRHGAAGEAIIQRDPFLAALCNYDLLWPASGVAWDNDHSRPMQAHWLLPTMGEGWLQSYTQDGYGEGGTAHWPFDTQSHYITKKDEETVTYEEVAQAALDIETNQKYWAVGTVPDLKQPAVPASGADSGSSPGDSGDDVESSNTQKNMTNHYYITMSVPFQNNAGTFEVWDDTVGSWKSLLLRAVGASIEVKGWTIKTAISEDGKTPIIDVAYNGSGDPTAIVGYFRIPKGSFVSKEQTTWDTPLDFAADVMEVYKCAVCPTNRRPTDKHQTFIKIHSLPLYNSYPCIKIGGTVDPNPGPTPTELHFCVFRHTEDWQTDYNVKLDKYDYETGEPLEGSIFELYEKFDDKDEINTENDGAVELYEGSEAGPHPGNTWQSTYKTSPVVWDDFRLVNSYTTDTNGHIEVDVPKKYHYEKTYCDGHPAPAFVEVPEEEEDEETGEITNEEEIADAQAKNMQAAAQWQSYFDQCESRAGEKEGVHFHWLSDEVNVSGIEEAAATGGDPGSTPDGGATECFGKETSYESSGCKQDTEETYEKFISLKYSYTWKEARARDGYILHDIHTDDVPIEVITTDSSQNGANSTFAIGDEKYDIQITVNGHAGDGDEDEDEETKAITLMSLMATSIGLGDGEDDNERNAASSYEPTIREGYDFEKTGFSAFKETVLDAVKFITEIIATPSTATGSESDREDGEEDEDGFLEDMDLIGDIGKAAGSLFDHFFTVTAYADPPEEDNIHIEEAESPDGQEKDTEEEVEEKPKALKDTGAEVNKEENGLSESKVTDEAKADPDTDKENGSLVETETDKETKESDETGSLTEPDSGTGTTNTETGMVTNPVTGTGAGSATGSGKEAETEAETEVEKEDSSETAATQAGNPSVFRRVLSFVGLSSEEEDTGTAFSARAGAREGDSSADFETVYSEAFTKAEQTDDFSVTLGPDDNWSHCDDRDSEGNSWRVYDHRTEGEIHFNKRDLDLHNDTSDAFDDYAQENADGALEGAVYGLFADEDITHPDGKTGAVYKKDNLVAVATTDRNGDGSFMVFTEAPGVYYDYTKGAIVQTSWYDQAPENRFREGAKAIEEDNHAVVNGYHDTDWTVDDYTDDKNEHILPARTERLYDDNEANNGNCWIGRPLILGKYYIRELSRSEGYELSVNGKARLYTNYDKDDPESAFTLENEEEGTGTVSITRNLYINGQESVGKENEPFFEVRSSETSGNGGFDIVVTKLPEGTKFYRQDTEITTKFEDVQVGWEYVPKTDESGNIIYKRAESDYSDPVYVGDGTDTILMDEVPATFSANNVTVKNRRSYDEERINNILRGSEATDAEGNPYYPDQIRLSQDFNVSEFRFIKAKLEAALRSGGLMSTPYSMISGTKTYSTEDTSIYSRGIRAGETDVWGVSGVTPGEVATVTTYGPQIVKVTIAKEVDGLKLSSEDMIRNLIQYYINNPYYNFGGLDSYTEYSDRVDFYIYAADTFSTTGVFAVFSETSGYELYVQKKFDPDDHAFEPYYVYVKYTEDGTEADAFGYYTNLREGVYGSTTYISAFCTPDSVVNGDGSIEVRKVSTPVYYRQGEIVYDSNGDPVPETVAVPKYENKEMMAYNKEWTEIPATYEASTGNYIIHINMPYTDCYGASHTDTDEAVSLALKAVCPETMHTLTEEDIAAMSADERYRFNVGDQAVSGLYEVEVLKAKASVYLDYAKRQEAKNGKYIEDAVLVYPGQEYVYQDGEGVPGNGTVKAPISVQERPIRQKVMIEKDIQTLPETKDVWYCLNCGYENADGDGSCHFCGRDRSTEETKHIDYAHDTYAAVHADNISAERDGGFYETAKDWLAKLLGGTSENEEPESIGNFRFKAYLKSNLERLYRDENGNIVWMDRNGNTMTPQYMDTNGDGNYDTFTWKYDVSYGGKTVDFPEKDILAEDGSLASSNVQKIYTEVEHRAGSMTTSARANNVWDTYADPQTGARANAGEIEGYTTSEREVRAEGNAVKENAALYSYDGILVDRDRSDYLQDTPNSGYTRILETRRTGIEDGTELINIESYNYEKFFDAIDTANTDLWDNDMHSTYTGNRMENYPGQHWFETFYEKYQKDDTDPDHTLADTDGADADGTAGGDKDTSFKPFRWIREHVFGYRDGYEKYPADNNGVNTENRINTSDFARANAQASDAVRQFAVKWYLEDEAAKLMVDNGLGENIAKQTGTIGYDEAVYDQALFEAIAKAYNYLRPFYYYDLDTIYSVEWDSAADGGTDKDYTTLSTDLRSDERYYNVSSYLPYGVYVVVEQQPSRRDKNVNDWENRSFSIEKPKEVIIPSVYDAAQSNNTTDNYDTHYNFNADTLLTDQAKASNYLIRFGEENSANTENQDNREFIIRAHGYYGDFEVYKYGLDIDSLQGTVSADNGTYSYGGWDVTQEAYDPLKDYYETDHRGEKGVVQIGKENGGNDASQYHGSDPGIAQNPNGADTANTETYDSDTLRRRFFYASIAEDDGIADKVLFKDGAVDDNNASGMSWHDNVRSTTGELTAYDGKYSAALVPWTVTEPADLHVYSSNDFTGYADVNERNTFFTTMLRINKVDSETGEYILHDDAIFGLYAASRYNSFDEIEQDAELIDDPDEKARFLMQFKPGDAKFYLQDTMITGSREFLEAMGATELQPYRRRTTLVESQTDPGHLYVGVVKKGTPVCLESERIDLSDSFGEKTGQMTVWSTKADIRMDDADTQTRLEYGDQNVGYFKTSQPVGAGVYVLAELKAPDGYARSKPVAIEVYSDETSYYVDGDMYAKVAAVRYEANLLDEYPYK